MCLLSQFCIRKSHESLKLAQRKCVGFEGNMKMKFSGDPE